jgi:Nucleotidyltransferase of unknown function (DUF6036)
MAADANFGAALQALTSALDELGTPSMIIGGVAVIAAGVPRQTIDIDATVLGRTTPLADALRAFERHDIVSRITDALEFARDRQLLLLQHRPTGITIEVSFAWLPFEEEALSRAKEIEIQGVIARVAQPEDLIVYKAAAWRDRDRTDIERLLVLHLDDINLDRVRTVIRDIAVALDDPTRVDAFDAIVERARQAR